MKKWKKILLTSFCGLCSPLPVYSIVITMLFNPLIYKQVYAIGDGWYNWQWAFNWNSFMWIIISMIELATFVLTTIFIWYKPMTDEQLKAKEIARLEAKLNKIKGEK